MNLLKLVTFNLCDLLEDLVSIVGGNGNKAE